MELRQLRYFVKVVELGSMGRAAQALGVVTSALSQQIARLETELSTVLLRRSATGATPTEAGLAFWQQAQLALRHADEAVQAAQHARLSGHVSLGMTPTTASVLGLPLLKAMRSQYPDVRLQIVESLSGNLSTLLSARQLDLAIVFQSGQRGKWLTELLLDEQLFMIAHEELFRAETDDSMTLATVAKLPLVLPSGNHGLRAVLNAAFERAQVWPNLVAEVDGLAMLMDVVQSGLAATIQPGSAMARITGPGLHAHALSDKELRRPSFLATLPEEELSPAALAMRNIIREVAATLVEDNQWPGASLYKS
ncbi:LysR family transcriptional regulator [Orrella marina]|uniref:LysR family transcriptional regulator n=1 Tax=Orrella marina TaxID=2163011 RepID=A0A2R4XMM6_9BURK|nr:LysR family transcriptional regulator [Orrella marina]AWB34969.1 LysR family transcriptional regulator [Orrella marina]